MPAPDLHVQQQIFTLPRADHLHESFKLAALDAGINGNELGPEDALKIRFIFEQRNALETTVFPTLDARANQAVRAAAAQAFGLTAVSPPASIDALLFSVRGVRLVRQVARAYGLRPHGLATWELLRRTMSSASLVAAADIAGGMLSHAILTNPFAAKIAGEVAGATVASQRMYRLGRVASAACRLFPRRSGKED